METTDAANKWRLNIGRSETDRLRRKRDQNEPLGL
jgi:hypothetical protein